MRKMASENSTSFIRCAASCSLALALLLQLILSCQSGAEATQYEQKLCGGDRKAQFYYYGDILKTSIDECEPHVKDAFRDFKKLVESANRNLCGLYKAQEIIKFYKKHLADKKTDDKTSGAAHLPEEFVNFAKAYGMQASTRCKHNVIEIFYSTLPISLDQEDETALAEFIQDNSPIARLLTPILGKMEFVLPQDFLNLFPDLEDEVRKALQENRDERELLLAKQVCLTRFRPLYEESHLAIAHLARHGIDYENFRVWNDVNVVRGVQDDNRKWSRIVFLCETLIRFREPTTVSMGKTSSGGSSSGTKSINPVLYEVSEREEAAPYRPFVPLEDDEVVWNYWDVRLRLAVNAYNPNISATERFRRKLHNNKSALLRVAYKSKQILMMAFNLALKNVGRDNEMQSIKNKLTELITTNNEKGFLDTLAKLARLGKAIITDFIFWMETGIIMIMSLPGLAIHGHQDGDYFEELVSMLAKNSILKYRNPYESDLDSDNDIDVFPVYMNDE